MKRLDEGDVDEDSTTGHDGGHGRGDGELAEKIAAIKGKRDRTRHCWTNWIAAARRDFGLLKRLR
jgi:hypothetical protein